MSAGRVSRRGLIAGGLMLPLAGAQRLRASQSLPAVIDEAVQAAIAVHAAPGVQVAVANAKGVVYSRGYGLGDIGAKTAVSERSVFRIGSLTKQFAAAAIIKLAAAGTVKLDAPVATYLPFFGKLKRVTLLELMHHTGGLHSDESETSLPSAISGPKTQIALAQEIAGQKTPFDFEPGTAWLYSNANYIVLGAVIEAVTRKTLAEAMAALIFAPLGLAATAVDHSGSAAADQVTGYSPTEGKAVAFEKAAFIEISDTGGAGAMRSTALDLCRWHQALLGGKLFGLEHVKTMLAPGRLRDGRLSGANRFSSDDVHYGETQYAGGLLISPPAEADRNILHYGAINGFAAALQTWVDAGVTMAVLCNGDIGPAMPFRGVRKAVVAALATLK